MTGYNLAFCIILLWTVVMQWLRATINPVLDVCCCDSPLYLNLFVPCVQRLYSYIQIAVECVPNVPPPPFLVLVYFKNEHRHYNEHHKKKKKKLKMCESSFLANLVFAFLIILQMSLKVGVLPQNLSTRNGHIYPFSLNLV